MAMKMKVVDFVPASLSGAVSDKSGNKRNSKSEKIHIEFNNNNNNKVRRRKEKTIIAVTIRAVMLLMKLAMLMMDFVCLGWTL
jgi:thiamine monophosphate synthase